MIPARSVNDALVQIGRDKDGYILPHGARFLPRLSVH
jgi:hypothetical protein